MANKYRYRKGQQKLAAYGVASATVIERSDMLFIDTTSNEVKPASAIGFTTNIATTQAEFADNFVGIALEDSASGETDDITVDIGAESVYEFDCTSATYNVGDLLGPSDNDDAGNALDDQSLEAAVAASSVARCFEKEEAAVTSVMAQFASLHNPSANHAGAEIG